MHIAILFDKIDIIHIFLEFKFDVNTKFIKGNTLLHFAVIKGTERAVTILIQAGSTVDAVNDDDETPLLEAVLNNKKKMYQILINSGASLNKIFNHGETYLHKVTRLGDIHLVLFFINQKIIIDSPNVYGETALTIAVKANNPALINVLLASGAWFSRKDYQYQTYIHLAAKYGCMNALGTLLKHRLLVDEANFFDETPLTYAVMENNSEMVQLLVDYGANVTKSTVYGQTYLHIGILHRSTDAIRSLLEKGHPANLRNLTGYTPIMTAVETEFKEAMDLLKLYGADIFQKYGIELTLLHIAAQRGCVTALKWLVKQGLPIDVPDARKSPPLHYAVFYGHFLATKELLDMGADVNVKDAYGFTAYHYATVRNFTEIADLVLSRGGY